MPSGATDVTVASVDFDGLAPTDTLRVYSVGSVWHVRGEMSGTAFDDLVVSGSGPMSAIGGFKLDAGPTEEAWIKVAPGGPRELVTFFVYDQCGLKQIETGGSPALFPVGASVTAAEGLRCNSGGNGITTLSTTSTDGMTFTGTADTYTISAGTTPTLVLAGTAPVSESDPPGLSAYQDLGAFRCGNLHL